MSGRSASVARRVPGEGDTGALRGRHGKAEVYQDQVVSAGLTLPHDEVATFERTTLTGADVVEEIRAGVVRVVARHRDVCRLDPAAGVLRCLGVGARGEGYRLSAAYEGRLS